MTAYARARSLVVACLALAFACFPLKSVAQTTTDAQVRALLLQNNIDTNNPWPCTQVGGLLKSSILELIAFQKAFGFALTVTGGSEIGNECGGKPHKDSGVRNHPNGWKVDLRLQNRDIQPYLDSLSLFITTVYSFNGDRCDNPPACTLVAPTWRSPTGVIFALEYPGTPNPGIHWDVLFDIKNLDITPSPLTLPVQQLSPLTVIARAEDNSDIGLQPGDFQYQSLDDTIATVDDVGNVIGVFPGTTQILIYQGIPGLVTVNVVLPNCTQSNPPPVCTPPPSQPGGTWVWNPNANGGAGGWIFIPNGFGQNNQATFDAAAVGPVDPNDKAGSQGVGPQQYISGLTPLRYAVFYGNEAAASAPAQKVVVTDQLNASTEDLTTFNLGPISLANQLVLPSPGLGDFSTTVDLRPSNNILVAVSTHLDVSTGLLTWVFQSLDPATNQPPTDPLAGFLPAGAGGSTFFTVMPKQGLSTNTQVQNQATVVFDTNPPINTSTWTNTLDNTAPTSQVGSLPATEFTLSFPVTWSGTDLGAGIQDFTIYVSDNIGPFTAFQTNTPSTFATFTGQVGHTYKFYSIARDLVGNVEGAKTTAEATTQVTTDTTPPVTIAAATPGPNANGWNNTNVTVTLNSTDSEPGGTGVKQMSYSATGAQTIASMVVAGAATSFTITTEGITTIMFFGTDNAGNVETTKTLTIKLDKTAPSINCGAPDGQWHATDVSIACGATDAGSGLAISTDGSFSLSTAVPTGTETATAATGTHLVCDVAGNCSTAGPVGGIMVDKKPPTVSITTPANTSYLLNQAVNANYTCSDGDSGVATCTGTAISGSPISTAPVDSKTFTVNATDKVGNVASPQSVTYSVTTIVMLVDIFMFGEKMRIAYLPDAFGWQGKIVLVLIGTLICVGWFLVA